MSGLIDYDTETAVSDWPMEAETGVSSNTAWSPGFMCGNTALALGIADADVIDKES